MQASTSNHVSRQPSSEVAPAQQQSPATTANARPEASTSSGAETADVYVGPTDKGKGKAPASVASSFNVSAYEEDYVENNHSKLVWGMGGVPIPEGWKGEKYVVQQNAKSWPFCGENFRFIMRRHFNDKFFRDHNVWALHELLYANTETLWGRDIVEFVFNSIRSADNQGVEHLALDEFLDTVDPCWIMRTLATGESTMMRVNLYAFKDYWHRVRVKYPVLKLDEGTLRQARRAVDPMHADKRALSAAIELGVLTIQEAKEGWRHTEWHMTYDRGPDVECPVNELRHRWCD